MAFELILVDAESQDFSVQRLAGIPSLATALRWARDAAPRDAGGGFAVHGPAQND